MTDFTIKSLTFIFIIQDLIIGLGLLRQIQTILYKQLDYASQMTILICLTDSKYVKLNK